MAETAENIIQETSAPAGKKLALLPAGGLSLALMNRVLGVLAALAFAYFVITIFGGAVKLIGVGAHIRQLETKAAAVQAEVDSQPIRSSVIDAALSNRNIFQPAGAVVATPDGAANSGAAGAYKLVGISESKDAAETYVMIENSQTKLTYFLQYGQPVEGLELERILEDKVIVKIGGKAVELE